MIIFGKSAKRVVASVLLTATITGSLVATAFGASASSPVGAQSLVPQSVRDMANLESQSPDDYSFIPERPVAPSTSPRPAPVQLATLVESNTAKIAVDAEEKCLASAIFFEARGESFEGQLAIAQVILNRVNSGRFASSICGVVIQTGQFSFVRGRSIPAVGTTSRDWREALAIARIAQAKLHRSSVADALFFHASRINPKWRLSRIGAVGNHIFYR